ncbi:receptor-transporting protein 3-like [Rhinatrema bivittatum]|uniref:receptor-transporting protein 3-like n=1 Tax=Rhinatrema bivittatum TaxID=194408 RepID=UPI00112AAA4B|nr:receptor-transporting protein 3-like [Rhinatrema bivittatum]XP_029472902.1 receptor-transporting protein 3-like [Rhinatrema bivittatum]
MELSTWQEVFQEKAKELGKRDTWTLLPSDSLQPSPGWIQYKQNTFARFHCTSCKRWWGSAQVHIHFHFKLSWGEGWVKMRVFKQQCKHCKAAKLEEPEFTRQNIEIVLTNLQQRIQIKCYGLKIDKNPVLTSIYSGDMKGPHDRDHCEACSMGVCKWRACGEGQRDQASARPAQKCTANRQDDGPFLPRIVPPSPPTHENPVLPQADWTPLIGVIALGAGLLLRLLFR